jgi:hypothetical protein
LGIHRTALYKKIDKYKLFATWFLYKYKQTV